MNERISIVVPVYNAEKYIEETMDSVLVQTYPDWELLLVLNGCVDATEEVVNRYKAAHEDCNLRIILETENKGAALARNRGVNEATGRYIAYVDADDIWKPEKLEHLLAFMKDRKSVV